MRALVSEVWMWTAVGSASVSATAIARVLAGDDRAFVVVQWTRYVAYLGRRLRRLHVFLPPASIAQAQLAAVFLVMIAAALRMDPSWCALVPLIAAAPSLVIERLARQRVAQLDRQADAFCLALANALKSTPSVGAAVETASSLMNGPVHEELELALKETRLGRSLAEALEAVGPRAGSRKLAIVLAAVLIGRQVGGNLPKVLDTTATTLREMERLEGVVRQRTAEGRMQLWGLSLAPIVICGAIQKLDPSFFEPLTTRIVGYIVLAAAVTLYIAGVIVARRVLAVNI
jgi:tight adherence protein B